jgi:hypothetical protein
MSHELGKTITLEEVIPVVERYMYEALAPIAEAKQK